MLAVAGVTVSVGAALGGHHPRSTPAGSAAAVRLDGGSTCGLAGLDPSGQTLPSAPSTHWVTVGLMSAPSSAAAGPGRKQPDGLRSCYAHTVAGALFAAANVYAMGTDPRLYWEILGTNVAAGPGRDAALRRPGAADNTGKSEQITGFKIDSYTPAAATIDLAFQVSDGEQIGFPSPMRWEDGDWKLQLADDGSPVFRPTVLSSLTGYTLWAGGQ